MFTIIRAFLVTAHLLCLSCKASDCFEGYCYFLGPKLDWHSAVSYCEEKGATLASIHSEEENQFISDLIDRSSWIGLNDIFEENVWQWLDGSTFSYSKWYPNQPDDWSRGEDFVEIHLSSNWNDLGTSDLRPPVCKYENATTCLATFMAKCYGNGAFGAECKGPSLDINFPVTLNKATSPYQRESRGITVSHVEILPEFRVDLTKVLKILFDAKINNIAAGAQYGSVFTLGAKYAECDRELFTLTQPMWQTTDCANNKWHSWKIILVHDAIRIYCDEAIVWNHVRVDSQDSWKVGDQSPFLAVGAFYSPIHTSWYSRSDMLIQNVEILTCETLETAAPSSFPSKLPTTVPTGMPTKLPTWMPTDQCDFQTLLCYGEGAFGAECNGPTTDIGYPEMLTKSTKPSQIEIPGITGSHIEIYPLKAIPLSWGTRVRFDAQIHDIATGDHYGSVFALSVKYDNSDSAVFTLTEPIWKSTPCNDSSWHSWDTIVYDDSVRVYCDEQLVYNHVRTDNQKTWEKDESPLMAIGAHYSGNWYCRCDMTVQNVEILVCDNALKA